MKKGILLATLIAIAGCASSVPDLNPRDWVQKGLIRFGDTGVSITVHRHTSWPYAYAYGGGDTWYRVRLHGYAEVPHILLTVMLSDDPDLKPYNSIGEMVRKYTIPHRVPWMWNYRGLEPIEATVSRIGEETKTLVSGFSVTSVPVYADIHRKDGTLGGNRSIFFWTRIKDRYLWGMAYSASPDPDLVPQGFEKFLRNATISLQK